ncbi:VOC family protein [Mesorhizobium sp. B2-1-8]|uniref:VOC family protein n=1 Tax=Mesorhizobium sp. B2-1-8 TaxID=2589967 RepID=UPI0011280CB1|nr:VOC family protein [Mesorhizobium sp. B2-1-8]UCI19938.1 VOC family protein [Mesorhizobium sp. B2-1-8]
MNTEIIVRPKLQHYGLTTSNLDTVIDWYGKVLGMTVNHRSTLPAAAAGRAPFSAFAFITNDESDHRIVFFETPSAGQPDGRRPAGLQHVAFEYETLDDLLGTYVRLKGLGIEPTFAADHGLGTSFYYDDPDRNVIELNVNNYGNPWTAAEHLRTAPPTRMNIDPDKMVAARKAGGSPWALHERAVAGEFKPEKPFDPRSLA